jgi:hypothetical protein
METENNWSHSLREKLDRHYIWPSLYTFKFIVPKEKVEQVKKLFPLHTSLDRLSKNGNYVSITVNMMMHDSQTVIGVYDQVSGIEGIIAL